MPQPFPYDDIDDAERGTAPEAVTVAPPVVQPTYRSHTGGPVRKSTREQVWDCRGNIMGCFYKPQIAPDIAKLTGQPIGKVCIELIELETEGKVRRTGQQGVGWDGQLYELWDMVLPNG